MILISGRGDYHHEEGIAGLTRDALAAGITTTAAFALRTTNMGTGGSRSGLLFLSMAEISIPSSVGMLYFGERMLLDIVDYNTSSLFVFHLIPHYRAIALTH